MGEPEPSTTDPSEAAAPPEPAFWATVTMWGLRLVAVSGVGIVAGGLLKSRGVFVPSVIGFALGCGMVITAFWGKVAWTLIRRPTLEAPDE